jgi:hypothetical protein
MSLPISLTIAWHSFIIMQSKNAGFVVQPAAFPGAIKNINYTVKLYAV